MQLTVSNFIDELKKPWTHTQQDATVHIEKNANDETEAHGWVLIESVRMIEGNLVRIIYTQETDYIQGDRSSIQLNDSCLTWQWSGLKPLAVADDGEMKALDMDEIEHLLNEQLKGTPFTRIAKSSINIH